jgi:hypothetical protein
MGPALGAVDYLRQFVVPRMRPNSRVIGGEPLPGITQAQQMLLSQTYASMVQAGYVRSYKADAGAVRVAYSVNGQPVEEWLATTVNTLVMPAANTGMLMQGQMNMAGIIYVLNSENVFGIRAPAGKQDKKLTATILASMRENPVYSTAAGQLVSNLNNTARQGAMDRQRIWYEAQQQVAATRNQTFQYQQAVRDRSSAQFSQTVRGVETYVNPRTGEPVELVGGYNNAWVNNRGEYLVSDTPGFDAGAALKEDWTQLRKAQ